MTNIADRFHHAPRRTMHERGVIEFFGEDDHGNKLGLKDLKAFKDNDPKGYTEVGDACIKELGCMLKES